jgi:hypothetical protein
MGSGGPSYYYDAGPANAALLLIPTAGQWQVSVAAYDAMGHLSPASNVIIVTTTVNAARVFLPLILVEK